MHQIVSLYIKLKADVFEYQKQLKSNSKAKKCLPLPMPLVTLMFVGFTVRTPDEVPRCRLTDHTPAVSTSTGNQCRHDSTIQMLKI